MYKKLPYDTEKDFVPITNYVNGLGYLFVAHPSLPAHSVKEVIALAKEKTLSYSSAGIGNGQHLAGELFSLKAGIHLLHVPYKGGGPALNAVLGGEVNLHFPAAIVAIPHVKAGRLRALGFTGASRLASLPDVPTIYGERPVRICLRYRLACLVRARKNACRDREQAACRDTQSDSGAEAAASFSSQAATNPRRQPGGVPENFPCRHQALR